MEGCQVKNPSGVASVSAPPKSSAPQPAEIPTAAVKMYSARQRSRCPVSPQNEPPGYTATPCTTRRPSGRLDRLRGYEKYTITSQRDNPALIGTIVHRTPGTSPRRNQPAQCRFGPVSRRTQRSSRKSESPRPGDVRRSSELFSGFPNIGLTSP